MPVAKPFTRRQKPRVERYIFGVSRKGSAGEANGTSITTASGPAFSERYA